MRHPWRSALVTGASSGIGTAIASQLGEAGVNLVLVARREDRLAELADEIRAAGPPDLQVEVIAADLTVPTELQRVADRVAADVRPIDLLVNSAGLGLSGPFAANDLSVYRQIIDLNIKALVELSHAAAGPMIDRRRGWMMNISSLGGHAPGPGFAVYSASKAFVTSFTESFFEELRGTGVSVTAICPGATSTEFGAIAGTGADELPGILLQTAEEVAAEALEATAAGRPVRVTGIVNRISGAVTTVLPRAANRRLSALVTDRL